MTLEAGSHTFGLRVSDAYMDQDEILSDPSYVTFDVEFDNQAPEISMEELPENLEIPHNCDGTDVISQVVSATSVDPEGDYILSHEWTDNGEVVCEALFVIYHLMQELITLYILLVMNMEV